MDINGLVNMVSALKNDDKNIGEFKNSPVAFVEKFLGVDLPDDQVNALIAGVSKNFLGKSEGSTLGSMLGGLLGGDEDAQTNALLGSGENAQANAVDSKGVDFGALIGKIASSKLDVNGDGKVDINDLGGFLGKLLGGGAQGDTQKEGEAGLSLGSLLNTFKI